MEPAGDLLQHYRLHRDEIDVLSDDRLLFVLDYVGHKSTAPIRALQRDLRWPLAQVLSVCQGLANRGFLTSPSTPNAIVKLTERGKVLLELALHREFPLDAQIRSPDSAGLVGTQGINPMLVKGALVLAAIAIAGVVILAVFVALFVQGSFRMPSSIPPQTGRVVGGETFWLLFSTIVAFVATPGLALFYGGLVRRKNVISTLIQGFTLIAVVTILWAAVGYSLAFAEGNLFIGDLRYVLLNGVSSSPADNHSSIPHLSFVMFQLMFAIITPAIITGAFAERMKFSGMLFFMVLWMVTVYLPIAHMVWASSGLLNARGGLVRCLDFAGGIVVHVSSGVSALVCALYLGRRQGYPYERMKPHNLVASFIGASLLWVGWFGFAAGNAAASASLATSAIVSTHFAAAAGSLTWLLAEWADIGKPTVLGALSGCLSGLAAIAPASGFVRPVPAMLVGVGAGVVCYFMATNVRSKLGYDDSLDVFALHGVGGTLGVVLTGVFATNEVNDTFRDPSGQLIPIGLVDGYAGQVFNQVVGCAIAWALAVVGTLIVLKLCDAVIGLRVASEAETVGLDLASHGEEAYARD